jgi:hypothetical protein
MLFDLSRPYKQQSSREFLETLIKKQANIEINEIKKRRSLDQNALYHVWLACIEKETGNDKNESHLLYRSMFLPKPDEYITAIIRPDLWEKLRIRIANFNYFDGLDKIIDIVSDSTTSLDTAKMTIFMEQVRDHANKNMGILLLTLQDQNFQDFYNTYK